MLKGDNTMSVHTAAPASAGRWPGVLSAYAGHLPPAAVSTGLTLFEGGTPLLAAPRLGARIGLDLYLKVEGQNPTGSFKDRGMVVAVAAALAAGSRAVACASTGNTAASAAAYSACAGLDCLVVLPSGAVAAGKLAQAAVHGARIIPLKGNFDQALNLVRSLSRRCGVPVVNSVNPMRIEGQKTAAFEVADALGDAPDVIALPVGNAGNITAYWRGFREYKALGKTARLPAMIGVQASGSDPLVQGRPIPHPRTRASAIRIGNPAGWETAVAARDESGGRILAVDDREIFAARDLLARLEGVFVEPASAAAVAALVQMADEGEIPRGSKVVAVLTGHGLKDPEAVLGRAAEACPVPATLDAVLQAWQEGGGDGAGR